MPAFDARSTRPMVVAIHASATPARALLPLLAPLSPACELSLPKRLGYEGASPWPHGMPASFDAEAEHLAPLLRQPPRRVHLIAHSFGAAVALQLALRWPEHIASLTLYEPTRFALLLDAHPCPEGREILDVAQAVDRHVSARDLFAAARRFVDYWSGRGSFEVLGPGPQAAIARHMPRVCAEFEAALDVRESLERYATLAMPVQLLTGERSPAPARRIAQLLAAQMPRARRLELPGLGHMGPVTHPEAVRRALPGWLWPAPQLQAA